MHPSRRKLLQCLVALTAVPAWRAATAADTLIRINIPGPNLMPFFPLELIRPLKIDEALGVRLAVRYLPSGVVATDDMLLGNADFAGVAFPVLPNYLAKGKPLKAIVSLNTGRPPFALVVRKPLAGTIRRVADLRGRTIGTQIGSSTTKTYLNTLAELLLAAHGVKSNEVRWAPTHQNLEGIRGAMSSDMVDAVSVEEPAASMLVRDGLGVKLASMRDTNNTVPVFGDQHFRAVVVAPSASLQSDPRRAELMVEMVQRALGWMQGATPEQIVGQLAIEDKVWRQTLIEVLKTMPHLFSQDGSFTAAEFKSTREFLQLAGIKIPDGKDIVDLVDDRWVRAR